MEQSKIKFTEICEVVKIIMVCSPLRYVNLADCTVHAKITIEKNKVEILSFWPFYHGRSFHIVAPASSPPYHMIVRVALWDRCIADAPPLTSSLFARAKPAPGEEAVVAPLGPAPTLHIVGFNLLHILGHHVE